MSKRVDSEVYYVTFEMFVADVRRMFENARTYNSPETIYYKCATRHVFHLSVIIFAVLCDSFSFWIAHFKDGFAGWSHIS